MVYSSIVLLSSFGFFLHIFVTESTPNNVTLPHNISFVILGASIIFIVHHVPMNNITIHPNKPATRFELTPEFALINFNKNFFIIN